MKIGGGSADPAARLARAGLALLYAFTVTAVAGYALFGRDPSRLAGLPDWALAFYGRSFTFFAQGHVWLAMAVLAIALVSRVGTKWLASFALLYAISLTSELAGTSWGLPFGAYEYTSFLGVKWLDRVPVVVPLSWFAMALPSWALAALALRGTLARIGVASLGLLAWDLTLDPAMSYATPYWLWGDTGPYYGMPWLNLFGWYVTGVVLMGTLAKLRAEEWTARVSPKWWAGYYGANLLMPLGMCVVAGLWLAVFATVVVLGLMGAGLLLLGRRTEESPLLGVASEAAR